MEKHPSNQPEHIPSFVAENNGIDDLPSTSSPSSDDDDDVSFFDNLPPGYVFIPTDEEIIGYLRKKVNNESMPRNRIRDVELYKWDPWDLAEKHKLHRSDKEWYYLTPRERKYKNGDRPARATKSGYYKATGKATDIYVAGENVGSKRSLVFYVGKSPNGDKSDWVMQEYKLKYPEGTKGRERQGKDDMLLDEWVLCKLHKKLHPDKKRGRSQEESCPNQEDIRPKKTKAAKKRKIKRKSEEVPVQPAEDRLSRNQVEYCHLMDEILSLTDQQEAHQQTNTQCVPIMNDFSQPMELFFPSDQELVQPNPSHFDSSTNDLIAVSGLSSNMVHATPINQYQASLITSQQSNGGPKTESYPSEPVQPNPSNVSSSTGSLWGHSGIVSNISTPAIRRQSSVSLNHLSNCGPQTESYPSKSVQPNPSHLLASTCSLDSHRGILSNRLHANPINHYGGPQTEPYPLPKYNFLDYNASSSISPTQEPIQPNLSHFPFTGLSSNISHATPIGPFPSSSITTTTANHLSSSNFSPMNNNGGSSLGGRLDLPLPQLAQHIQMVMSQQRTTTLPPPKGTFNHDHQHRIAGNLPMSFDQSYLRAIFNPGPRRLASLNQVPSKLVPPPKCEPHIIN